MKKINKLKKRRKRGKHESKKSNAKIRKIIKKYIEQKKKNESDGYRLVNRRGKKLQRNTVK